MEPDNGEEDRCRGRSEGEICSPLHPVSGKNYMYALVEAEYLEIIPRSLPSSELMTAFRSPLPITLPQ